MKGSWDCETGQISGFGRPGTESLSSSGRPWQFRLDATDRPETKLQERCFCFCRVILAGLRKRTSVSASEEAHFGAAKQASTLKRTSLIRPGYKLQAKKQF